MRKCELVREELSREDSHGRRGYVQSSEAWGRTVTIQREGQAALFLNRGSAIDFINQYYQRQQGEQTLSKGIPLLGRICPRWFGGAQDDVINQRFNKALSDYWRTSQGGTAMLDVGEDGSLISLAEGISNSSVSDPTFGLSTAKIEKGEAWPGQAKAWPGQASDYCRLYQGKVLFIRIKDTDNEQHLFAHLNAAVEHARSSSVFFENIVLVVPADKYLASSKAIQDWRQRSGAMA